jgi:predicted RNA-binding Zn-ribbon protein involved in translation (DUF1610 family)
MKLAEIKKLNIHEFVERYPFVQTVSVRGEKCFYKEDYDDGTKAGDPMVEFGPGHDFGGWTDILLCWAEKVKPYYDKMPADMKENFYIMDLKEKYGDMRLYLSGYPTGEFEKIKEYTDMVEHLSTFTCLQCGHISRASKADKLLTWRTYGWISYYCKNCAKKYLRRDNKEYGVKMSKAKFKQAFNDTFKRIEGDWFARFITYNGDKEEHIAYDCRELLEGMF